MFVNVVFISIFFIIWGFPGGAGRVFALPACRVHQRNAGVGSRHTHTHTQTRSHTHTQTHVHTLIHTHTHTPACSHTHSHSHIHTYTQTNTLTYTEWKFDLNKQTNQIKNQHVQVVLAGYSPYLRAMFTNGMLESGRDMVDIHTHTHTHTLTPN